MEAQSIVEDLAAVIKRPITLEDASGRLIAYSVHDVPVDSVRLETLLRKGISHSTREALTSRGVYRLIDGTGGITVVPGIPEIGFEPRVAMAIRRESEVLGYLWVACGQEPISAEAEHAVLEAARLLSRQLAKARPEGRTKSLGQESDLVKDLVGGVLRDDSEVRARVRETGWQLIPWFQVLVIHHMPVSAKPVSWYLGELLSALGDRYGHPLAGFVDGRGVVVLSGSTRKAQGDMASSVNARMSRCGEPLAMVGVGGLQHSVGDIQESYAEALRAIDLGARVSPKAAFLEYRSLAPYDLLLCMAACPMCGYYGRDAIERLVTYDSMHGQGLVQTLEAYLDWYGRRRKAAAQLNVHPNTLDYRIRKISEITGLDLDDPSVRLTLHIWTKALLVSKR
ncbi:MAG: PucR family transcriptional regulator [Bacillota bacterium]